MFRNEIFKNFIERNACVHDFIYSCDRGEKVAFYGQYNCYEIFIFKSGRKALAFSLDCGCIVEIETFRTTISGILTQKGYNPECFECCTCERINVE